MQCGALLWQPAATLVSEQLLPRDCMQSCSVSGLLDQATCPTYSGVHPIWPYVRPPQQAATDGDRVAVAAPLIHRWHWPNRPLETGPT